MKILTQKEIFSIITTHISINMLCIILKCTKSQIYNWRNGKTNISYEKARKPLAIAIICQKDKVGIVLKKLIFDYQSEEITDIKTFDKLKKETEKRINLYNKKYNTKLSGFTKMLIGLHLQEGLG